MVMSYSNRKKLFLADQKWRIPLYNGHNFEQREVFYKCLEPKVILSAQSRKHTVNLNSTVSVCNISYSVKGSSTHILNTLVNEDRKRGTVGNMIIGTK